MALIFATAALRVGPLPNTHCPVFKISFSSMSNIMSSWFQYEALKYLSFPMQGLAKSTKIVVTMAMGKVLDGKSYTYREYGNALAITMGLLIFRMGGNGDTKPNDKMDDTDEDANALFMLGLCMIFGYVICDSFTSTWQGALFRRYKISPFQMMQGINFASSAIGFFMLASRGNMGPSIAFMMTYPLAMVHCVMMSLCSATGQLFIFKTIQEFGAVVFSTVMTCRQVVSILLSMYLFGHSINAMGVLGMACVFTALFLKLADSARKKRAGGK
jgi:adenosine 3'-phospho 5'-phosphosulfate transporter B2